MGSLEWPFPPSAERPEGVEALVVLGGWVRPAAAAGMPAELGADSLLRCVRAADLYRRGPRCPVVVSGGIVGPDAPPVARAMQEFLIAHGVAAGDVIVEDRSGNTHENAVETARLLRELGLKRVLLITDANHLRRALGCFRAAGVDALPCGCRYATGHRPLGLRDFLPDPAAAADGRDAWHEWIGIAWYKLLGYL
jgi:uncharacterized SAM-binding protein YcdF (DUF218 family)